MVKFIVKLHYGSSKKDKTSVKASLYGLPHPYKSVNDQFYKKN